MLKPSLHRIHGDRVEICQICDERAEWTALREFAFGELTLCAHVALCTACADKAGRVPRFGLAGHLGIGLASEGFTCRRSQRHAHSAVLLRCTSDSLREAH